ncbi:hypothetical protein D3C81_2263000 [compost metagenome]
MLDKRGVSHNRANDRLRLVTGDSLQLDWQAFEIIRRMLAIDQQPVESGVGRKFGTVGIGQLEP